MIRRIERRIVVMIWRTIAAADAVEVVAAVPWWTTLKRKSLLLYFCPGPILTLMTS